MVSLFTKKNWLLLISLCFMAQGFAQNTDFIGTQTEVYAQQPTLTKMFTDFHVFSLNSRELKAKCSANDQVSFNLVLGNVRTLPIHLMQNDIRSADYRLMSGTDKGAVELPKGANTTYMGYTDDGAKVRMTINDDFIMGYYKYGRESFFIEPLKGLIPNAPNDLYIAYRSKDIIPNPNLKCGLTETEHKTTELNRGNASSRGALATGCMNVRLAIATDYDAYANKFGGNITDVTNHTIAVTNNVITDYDSDFDKVINFNIVTNYVSTTASNTLETALTSSIDGATVHQNFSVWASGTNFVDGGFGMMHDLGTLWIKRNIDGNVLGRAWNPGICSPIVRKDWPGNPNASFRYNVIELDFGGVNSALLRLVTSHEYGHNFSCNHDASGSNIMAGNIDFSNPNVSTVWSPASIAAVNAHIATSNCLIGSLTAVEASPTARFNLNTTECVNYLIPLNDASGPSPLTWNWTITGGSPASATAQNTSVTFNSAGSKNITLDVSNNSSCGGVMSNSITKTINIINQQHPTTPSCSINALNQGITQNVNIGIYNVTLGGINYSSGYTFSEGGVYYDRTCDQFTTLSSLTNPISVTVGDLNDERVKVYIDLNNDGIFQTNELLLEMTGRNTLSGSLSLPCSSVGITTNTLLRLRVVSDANFNSASACLTPQYGQIEDYGIIVSPSAFPTNPKPQTCSMTTTNASVTGNFDFGIWGVTLGAFNHTSGGSFQDGTAYIDRTCTQSIVTTTLINTISVSVGTFNPEYVKVFIDYNNDGTFSTDELALAMGSSIGAHTGTFTVPNSAIRYIPLRMRIISDYHSVTSFSSCFTPFTYGQVEDFNFIISTTVSTELTTFTAHPLSKTVELTWQTASEKNNDHFDIERSTDGKTFSKIGEQKGHGTTSQVQNYDYLDTNPFSGINYYRLKQVDIDGQFTYSKTVSVEMGNSGKNISVYPNPVKDKVMVETTIQGDYTIDLFDITGKLMQSYKVNQPLISLTINDLPNGVYMVSIKSNAVQQTFKIVKQ